MKSNKRKGVERNDSKVTSNNEAMIHRSKWASFLLNGSPRLFDHVGISLFLKLSDRFCLFLLQT